jgi:hypothetical protein
MLAEMIFRETAPEVDDGITCFKKNFQKQVMTSSAPEKL